jgi:M26 IgA1-specific metallo-endopeptidase-like protein
MKRIFGFLVAVPVLALSAPGEAQAQGCVQIKNANQLQAMRNNLAGNYCLANDIDAGSIANFEPVGSMATPFTGTFTGNGFTISNLTINNGSATTVGLFGTTNRANLSDVTLRNANVTGTRNSASVGAMVGWADAGIATSLISGIHVTGRVTCTGFSCNVGGIAGLTDNETTVTTSWSSAIVTGSSGYTGGLVGNAAVSNTTISFSYATGRVTCGQCTGGGLVGNARGTVMQSFAVGPVTGGGPFTQSGGLIGLTSFAVLSQVYATGRAAVDNGSVGGLLGEAFNGTMNQAFATGAVRFNAASSGGLIGRIIDGAPPTTTASYWDAESTGRTTTAGNAGTSRTTAQLRSALPAGFAAGWGINRTLSYPYLTSRKLDFRSTLATLVVNDGIFVFLPLLQSDKSLYNGATNNIDEASLATVYTMIGRAIGITAGVPQLDNVAIDTYFWKDATKRAVYTGPVTANATLGVLTAIAANKPLDASNVIRAMDRGQLVILRGNYGRNADRLARGASTHRRPPIARPPAATGEHWMLATLYTKKANGLVDKIIANDPLTGRQLEIDPVSKEVVGNFPLNGFTINGYQPVTVKLPGGPV